jgi:glycosyltransferase involved in cell wall biosynthesis
VGASYAIGDYLCFLDDDDYWTDNDHLLRAEKAIKGFSNGEVVDLYMGNQIAFQAGCQKLEPIWLESLGAELQNRKATVRHDGAYVVTLLDLLRTRGHCHVNVLTVRKALFDQIGGFDEGIRWECDRDFFLRLVDRAQLMLHHPAIVSRHNIPDPAKMDNMTTAISMLEKRLLQLRVYDKAFLFAAHPDLRSFGLLHKGYVLKKISMEFVAIRKFKEASSYAIAALGCTPGIKWNAVVIYCWLRAIFTK